MVKNRSIVVAIILTIVTCGLYGIYWMAAVQNESLAAAKESGTSGGMVVVLTIVTCGIYGFVWAYQLGERIDRIKGSSSNSGLIYLILALFGLNIVDLCLAQDTLNKCA